MKKKIVKHLRVIAEALPPIIIDQPYDRAPVSGRLLIAHNVTKEESGQSIDPDRRYTSSSKTRSVTRVRDLKREYAKGGTRAADAYCRQILGDKYVSPFRTA